MLLTVAQSLACQSETSPRVVEISLPPLVANPDGETKPPMSVTPPDTSTVDCSQLSPGIAEARLLTRLQYDNTVRDLLGELSVPGRSFPEENLLLGFGNNADAHRASLLLTERHLAAARDLATAAVARGVDQLLPCAAGDRSEACISSFITQFGYRAYRRPIHADESAPMLELWRTANATWGFDEALQLLLQTFLQAPQLLYRTESASVEPSPASGGARRLPDRLAALVLALEYAAGRGAVCPGGHRSVAGRGDCARTGAPHDRRRARARHGDGLLPAVAGHVRVRRADA
jgi:hypothetical protein